MDVKQCMGCKEVVKPRKPFAWVWFIIGVITGVFWIFVLIHHWVFKKYRCPECGHDAFVPITAAGEHVKGAQKS